MLPLEPPPSAIGTCIKTAGDQAGNPCKPMEQQQGCSAVDTLHMTVKVDVPSWVQIAAHNMQVSA